MRLIPSIVLCLAVAGCATQTATIPDTGIIPQQTIAASFRVDHEWWKAYGDNTLNHIVELALLNNTDLKQSAITMNKALYEANLLGTRARILRRRRRNIHDQYQSRPDDT